ncbi:MAG: IS4 family transposase [Trebonia sp.]
MRAAMSAVTIVITIAAGAFAPGHLGELTRVIPFDLVDAVLEEEGSTERRLRLIPSRCGVYFLLALALFPDCSYLGAWGKLTAALRLRAPSESALRNLRCRIGARPLQRIFEILAGPLGRPRTPGIMFCGLRTVSFDGCKSVKVPDTSDNRAWLGKLKAVNGETGYPALMLMTLVETGTRALLGAAFGPLAGGETGWAARLLHLLDESMLVLMDRGFDGGKFLAQVAETKAQFIVRLTSNRRPPLLLPLPDGSFLSVIGGARVRIITAAVTVTCHDGTSYSDSYRLATTLLDHRKYPATALIGLYHERWEHETAYLALRHTILKGRVLRSGTPAGIRQETWALLALYQALRTAIADAVQTVPGTDPDRAGWTIAVETARNLTVTAANITDPDGDLPGDIGRAVLARLHGPRRPRVCARKVKSPLSRWNKHPAGKPRTTKRITAITSTVITAYRQSARQRPQDPAPGEPAGTPGQAPAGHVASPDAGLAPAGPGTAAASPPRTPRQRRPRPRSQPKRGVAPNPGNAVSDQANTHSRPASKKTKPAKPLDPAPKPLTARHWA